MARQGRIVAYQQQGGFTLSQFLQQQLHETVPAGRIQGGGGFIGDDQFGGTDQGASSGHSLLLSNGELGNGPPFKKFSRQLQPLQQPSGFRLYAAAAPNGCGTPPGRQGAGQADIIDQIQVGQQIELLEQHTDPVGPDPVALVFRKTGQRLPAQPDLTAETGQNTADQVEQGALSAAGRALDKQVLAWLQLQPFDLQDRRLAGPGEAELPDIDHWRHGSDNTCSPAPSCRRCWPDGVSICTSRDSMPG